MLRGSVGEKVGEKYKSYIFVCKFCVFLCIIILVREIREGDLMGDIKIKKYACFTPEQQDAYAHLPITRRKYVDFRGEGHTKRDAYVMAYGSSNKASQKGYIVEHSSSVIQELIETIQNNMKGKKAAKNITDPDSEFNKQMDAMATQEFGDKLQEAVEQHDPSTMERLKFYRDIMNGKIKTVRKTQRLNALGAVIETKIEETSDIETRIKARKEIDRILGLTNLPDMGSLQMGDITINIVDASKKDELEDSRNTVVLDIDKQEEINGEKVVVVDDVVEQEGGNTDGTKR